MVSHNFAGDPPLPSGTARRLRKTTETGPNVVVMVTVVCHQCGARFAIGHSPAFQNAALAAHQATWLADKFVWDHIQEARHGNSIRLPGARDMKLS